MAKKKVKKKSTKKKLPIRSKAPAKKKPVATDVGLDNGAADETETAVADIAADPPCEDAAIDLSAPSVQSQEVGYKPNPDNPAA